MLEKAKITIHGENSDRIIPVMFNPEQYNLDRGVNYARLSIPGVDNPILQFVNGNQTTLNLSLQFDTYSDLLPSVFSGDVREWTAPITEALWIDGSLHAPPTVTFSWGSFSFDGVITDIKQSFTMFLPSGKPVRSKMDITFSSNMQPLKEKKKSPFESPDRSKIRYTEQGFDLWRLADKEYGDASLWRLIADANGIDNPRKCKAGRLLRIPPIESKAND